MQKGSAPIALVLIGLIIIIGGGYLYLNYKNNSQSLIPTPSKPADTLETYSNKELGFEFRYSKRDLTVKEDNEEEFNKRGNGDFRKNFLNYVTYEPGKLFGAVVVLDKSNSYEANPFTLWVFDNQSSLDVDNWYKNYWYYPFVWGDYTARRNDVAPVNEATISGQLVKYGTVTYQPNSPKFFYLSFDGKMYLFRIIGEKGEQILQSFKFIEDKNDNSIKSSCVIGGCSGQLCKEESEGNIVSTCEYREEYTCYKTAKCERQSDGKCNWTKTEELSNCIEEKRGSSSEVVF